MSPTTHRSRILHRPSASMPANLSPMTTPSYVSSLFVTQELDESPSPSPPLERTPSDSEESDEETQDCGQGNDSDSDLTWGHPLQRMVNTRPNPHDTTFHLSNFASSTFPPPEINFDSTPRRSLVQHIHFLSFEDGYTSSEEEEEELDSPVALSDDGSETSSVDWDTLNFEEMVDELVQHPTFQPPEPGKEPTSYNWPLPASSPDATDTVRHPILPPELPLSDKPPHSHFLKNAVQILCLHVDSPTLYLLLYFNHPDLRNDPWNILPRVVGVSQRNIRLSSSDAKYEHEKVMSRDTVFLMLPHLSAFDHPPLKTVSNWVDFIRQGLEGLTFLHEHDVVHLLPPSPTPSLPFIVDLGAVQVSPFEFDRTVYPVRYYYNRFSSCHWSGIVRLISQRDKEGEVKNEVDDTGTLLTKDKTEDIKRWGEMIQTIIQDVPPLDKKLAPLVQSMLSGNFTAEHARKLCEALCWGLPA